VAHIEELTRLDLNGDGYVGDEPPEPQKSINVRGELQVGRHSIYTDIPLKAAHYPAWRSFCQDVAAKRCNFSGQAATDHGLDVSEWETVKAVWASHDQEKALIDPASVGPRLTPVLTRMGWAMVRLFARTPPDAEGA
jgi:hypothetical protein